MAPVRPTQFFITTEMQPDAETEWWRVRLWEALLTLLIGLQNLLQHAEGVGLSRGRARLLVLLDHLVDLWIPVKPLHGKVRARTAVGERGDIAITYYVTTLINRLISQSISMYIPCTIYVLSTYCTYVHSVYGRRCNNVHICSRRCVHCGGLMWG